MLRVLAAVALLVLSGCSGLAPGSPPNSHDQSGTLSTRATIATHVAENATHVAPPLSEPERDVPGWENGFWYNESLSVTATNGLNLTERNAVLQRTIARVEFLREVEFENPVVLEVYSRERYRERLNATPEPSPATRTVENAMYEALFLVGEDRDATDARTRSRADGVSAFYSPATDRIVVVTDGSRFETDEPLRVHELLFAHELVHVLQHRHYGVKFAQRGQTFDERRAYRAVVEGEASYLALLYQQHCEASWQCIDATNPGTDRQQPPHPGLAILDGFAYTDGGGFVAHVHRNGGWEAVVELYDDPPVSTEQVAFPGRYGRDEPASVTVPEQRNHSWRRVTPPDASAVELGLAGIATMFVYPALDGKPGAVVPESTFNTSAENRTTNRTDPFHYGFGYAEGWGGDRLVVYRYDANRTAYVWRTTWDSPADAREFARGYRELLAYWGAEPTGENAWRIPEGQAFADSFRLTVDGANVTVVNEPAAGALDVAQP